MLIKKIKTSLINFRDKLLDTPFNGLEERYEPIDYDQKWLEKAVHDMPAGDKYDYCFVWCLCCAYVNMLGACSWEHMAEALKMVNPANFDKVTGYVKSIEGITKDLAQILNSHYYIDRVASFNLTGNNCKEAVDYVNMTRRVHKLGLDYFVMSAYEPEHYMFVSHSGIELNPFPGYQGTFKGFRVYQLIKRS